MSSSSSGGGASFFASFFTYLGASFLTSAALGAELATGAGPEEPICLVPSAMSW